MDRNVGQCKSKIRILTATMSWLWKIAGISRLYTRLRNDDIRQSLSIQTTLVDKVVQGKTPMVWHIKRMQVNQIPHNAYMQDSKEKETKADQDYAEIII